MADGSAELCPRFHRAVELIGRRWTGAILRVLMHGAQRFNGLMGHIPGISDRLLSERLRELEAAGLVKRTVCQGPPVSVVYELTPQGSDLEPALTMLGKWAERWMPAAEAPGVTALRQLKTRLP
ncbi:MAG: helix-turn-helix transcriptional regulator [Candidatus Eremiobacteraeota bacterium]|nr:helix-turn-helix transcriptional regulator [Candidatus Eremiobacteraeota bacterium]